MTRRQDRSFGPGSEPHSPRGRLQSALLCGDRGPRLWGPALAVVTSPGHAESGHLETRP